ncbi:hypothetical protein GCM10023147_13210 [Tsukamurella soli]|uniref:Aldehyde dehydrogenase domain-containing protein n=2 Tax=Tsukamurella soli TaxID=644556 RepID=A0ABP8JBR4_9ACTN
MHLDWAAKHAESRLRRRRVPAGPMNVHLAAHLEYQPLGVIGVIGPWRHPVYTPLGSITYALAAGNAVVFKPSEPSRREPADLRPPRPGREGGRPHAQPGVRAALTPPLHGRIVMADTGRSFEGRGAHRRVARMMGL